MADKKPSPDSTFYSHNTALKKIYFLFCVVLFLISCRKDNSYYPSQTEENCLIMASNAVDESYVSNVKYSLDSVITESVTKENGVVTAEWYLNVESPWQFIFMKGGKKLTDAVSRIYLNPDGTLAKEVAVTLNSDGKTFTEVAEEVNTFTYNDKKQVISAIKHLGEDKGIMEFEYDDKNRIQKISISADDGTEAINYENITYETEVKKDNLLNIVLFESLSSYFLPSISNVYIKSYTISYPDIPFLDVDTKFSYKFSNGKLSELTETITTFGTPLSWKLGITLNCK